MQHHGHTHGLPGPARQLLAVSTGRWGQGLALHMAEQHARTFEQWAAFQITGNAATAFIALPLVGLETCAVGCFQGGNNRSEEHTSELQSLMRISYAVFCLKK